MNQYDVYLADLNPTVGREQFGSRLIKRLTSVDNFITRKKIVDVLFLRFEDVG